MPFTKCPICGQIVHLNVSNTKQWYATYYPDLPDGSLAPGRCLYCWPELSRNDHVVIRQCLAGAPQAEPGEKGTIQAILTAAEHGSIYEVLLESGKSRYFVRAEIKKVS